MGKFCCLLLASLLSVVFSAHAQEQKPSTEDADTHASDVQASLLDTIPGFYISPLLSGAYLIGDADAGSMSIDFDGYFFRGGVALGYQFENVRLEIEPSLGYARTHSDLPPPLKAVMDSDEKIFFAALAGDVYYDLPSIYEHKAFEQTINVRPYIGGGAGMLYANFDKINDDDVGMIGQAMAGLGVRLTPRLYLDIGYRLVYVPRLNPAGTDLEATFHTGEVKMRYRF